MTFRRSIAGRLVGLVAALTVAVVAGDALAQSNVPAKKLFGGKSLPAAMPAQAYGFYSKGCLSGGIAIATDGPHWQAMRLSRNRRWGHPQLIATIEKTVARGSPV